ncbi:MAG: FkbM family methyltransferase [Verrucomicrobiales bacterium]
MFPFFSESRRLTRGPIFRKYFGIRNDHFTGAACCPGSPSKRLTIALLDAEGKIAGIAVADQPSPRAQVGQDCGFRIPIPLAWARNPDAHPHFSFRILETGLEFPKEARKFSLPRKSKVRSPVAAIEAAKILTRLRAATRELAYAPRPWLLVIHETHRTGAPLIALSLARRIAGALTATPLTLCLGEEGALFGDFAALGPAVGGLSILDGEDDFIVGQIREELAGLRSFCHPRALVNSFCSAPLVPALAAAGFEIVSLVHEYPFAFSDRAIREMLDHSAELVFPCEDVRREYALRFGEPAVPVHVRPQGVNVTHPPSAKTQEWKVECGLPLEARVVLACGTVDLRKGFDWFCDFALGFLRHSPFASSTHFVWLGKCGDRDLVFHSMLPLRLAGWESHVHLAGERPDPWTVLACADVFLMCSRIDPFPTVVLEALALGIPVVGFDRAQGCAELLEKSGFGRVVPAGDQAAVRQAIESYLGNDDYRAEIRLRAPAWIQAHFPVDGYATTVANYLGLQAAPTTPRSPDWVVDSSENASVPFVSWKGALTNSLRGLRASIASGENPLSWPMPWGPLEFQRAGTIPPQLEDIILHECYRVASEEPIRRIVEGGCNVGVSVLWFASAYPEASIEAYEADPALADLCRRNLTTAGLAARAEIVSAALWTRNGEVGFDATGDDRGHISTSESAEHVPCRDIAAVIADGVDLLKLDIEGAEIDCLEHLLDTGVIRKVRHLVAEVHLAQSTAHRAYRMLAGLAEAGFATTFEAGTHNWCGPDTTRSPFPSVGSNRTFMLLRAWQSNNLPTP